MVREQPKAVFEELGETGKNNLQKSSIDFGMKKQNDFDGTNTAGSGRIDGNSAGSDRIEIGAGCNPYLYIDTPDNFRPVTEIPEVNKGGLRRSPGLSKFSKGRLNSPPSLNPFPHLWRRQPRALKAAMAIVDALSLFVVVMSKTKNRSAKEVVLEDFIEIYRSEPCLWQVKNKYYHDRNKKEAAYAKLVSKLNLMQPGIHQNTNESDVIVRHGRGHGYDCAVLFTSPAVPCGGSVRLRQTSEDFLKEFLSEILTVCTQPNSIKVDLYYPRKNQNMVLQLVLPANNLNNNYDNNYLSAKSIDDMLDYKLWAVLEDMVCHKRYPNIKALKRALARAVANFPMHEVRATIDEWPVRHRSSRPVSFHSQNYVPNGSYVNRAYSPCDLSEYAQAIGSPGTFSVIHTPALSHEDKGTPPEEKKKAFVSKISFQIASERVGKPQLVDTRGRVSTTHSQSPKISVSKKSSDERSLIVHGYLDDKWCYFVIDTGATRTILRPDILPKPSKELFGHVKLETATGELIPVHGEVSVKIQLGSKIMYHQVLTAYIRDDSILGLDILSKHGFVVDVQNRIMQIKNKEIVMVPKLQDYNQSGGIIVEEDIQIPQGLENIVIAKVDGNCEGLSTGIVEASERNDGLLVARSLVQMKNQIPVRIANISDKKIILKKNEALGRCEPVERHESTTYTSCMLTSGREMKLPTDLMLGCPLEATRERSLPEFVKYLRERMNRVYEFAREKLKTQSDKMKQRLDTTSTETAFELGDAVSLYAPERMKGKNESPKLQRNWKGPYTIIKPKVVLLERLARYTGHDSPDWFVVEDPPPRTEDNVIRDE
ncbi:hypothetical protein NQ318_010984 [Aromia moschata]|uniref:MADF domain-containing protein n=1 Tax=Aromia moschata TaxID=1265417 RepID=A0AAV8YLF1_9CUCU|nr:hypothetical protein NQ318_010984 [Aromia moschata]